MFIHNFTLKSVMYKTPVHRGDNSCNRKITLHSKQGIVCL